MLLSRTRLVLQQSVTFSKSHTRYLHLHDDYPSCTSAMTDVVDTVISHTVTRLGDFPASINSDRLWITNKNLSFESLLRHTTDSDYRCTYSILQHSQYASGAAARHGRKDSSIEGRPHGDGPISKESIQRLSATQTPTRNAHIIPVSTKSGYRSQILDIV
ncbi:hypothetical protein EDD22DRAFT_912879 [Suillus occidentalis]|nr:hypothetical protein EDD22DRAFT_912879 [Suillus occidentalis]